MSKKPPVPHDSAAGKPAVRQSSSNEIDEFLNAAKQLGPASAGSHGRLLFALDATMSRQPTWDLACGLQAEMFQTASQVGNLSVQLVYFRGFGECRASQWVSDTGALRDLMVKIDCRGGHTQIRKVLLHARRECKKQPIAALVYVGDAMEENVDQLCQIAGELGLLGVKAFMFHEGQDPTARQAFREIARLTNGAYLPFDSGSIDKLRDLLGAVAKYAAGGFKALELSGGRADKLLLSHIRPG